MKITLITASYNSATTLEETIKSVIAQNYPLLEYIVIDGASTDNTIEIIKKYEKHITKWVSEKDKGIYDAFNKGLEMASGDIIGFLNSDDMFAQNDALKKIAKIFQTKSVDGVYGDLHYVDFDNTQRVVRKWKAGHYKPGAFLYGWMPPHPSLYLRKSCYTKYGNFNTSFISAADYELMLRMIHKNQIILAYLPEVVVKMRMGGISNKSVLNRIRANKEDRRAWKVNKLKMPFYTTWLKPLRKISQFI